MATPLTTSVQHDLLTRAIARVEALRPGLREADVTGFLCRVVALCAQRDPAFGRKANPSGALSPNVLGVQLPQVNQAPYFEAIDFVRDNPAGGNPIRVPWHHYVPGSQSDHDHVGPDQAWVALGASFTDVWWEDAAPVPEDPVVRESAFVRFQQAIGKEVGHLLLRVTHLEAAIATAPPTPAPDLAARLGAVIAELEAIRERLV